MRIDPADVLRDLHLDRLEAGHAGASVGRWLETSGERLESRNPTTGAVLGAVRLATAADYDRVATAAVDAFGQWRTVPAPRRGQVVRALGEAFRRHKRSLGALVSLEMGKVLAEGEGEIQEVIDIADFAVGLSRQLYGKTMHSERPHHRMYEQWHPLGAVGIISAFNFPVAVWSWNAMIAAVCGDTTVWKPSLKTPLTSIAVQRIVDAVLEEHGCPGVMTLVIGNDADVGGAMVDDRRLPLISATGSCAMGRAVAARVSARFGRTLLELGGNNGVVVMDDANLDLALRAVLFGAVGTSGQRCTSTRRVFLHRSIAAAFTQRLVDAYRQVRIGDPLDEGVMMGPLVDPRAADAMMAALDLIRSQGGRVVYGGRRVLEGVPAGGAFVEPTVVASPASLPMMPMLKEEVFAPILHLVVVDSLEEAIALHNDVPQGLSSAIFTTSMRNAERFLSAVGSDCGIANVNLGTSGAEIGGAFGGEKETGGGREAGSDSWKAYMRRQTCTLNWGEGLPLAQGIRFEADLPARS